MLTALTNVGALRRNVEVLTTLAGPNRLDLVIKCDGYGHGAIAVAKETQDAVSGWCVATIGEAVDLVAAGFSPTRITMFLFRDPGQAATAAALGVRLVCGDEQQLLQAAAARDSTRPARVALEVDSGMGRNGTKPGGWERLCDIAWQLQRAGRLRVEGVMTHFACADQRHHPLNDTQVDRFAWAVECAAAADLPMTWVSARNSAAVLNGLRVPFVTHDRVGLAAYGLDPRDEADETVLLEPVLTLSGPVLTTKVLRAGESASYGARWVADQDMRVALIGGGYGDGIPRVDGLVVVGERSTHEVLGPVNMDQMIVADPGGRLHRGDTVRVVGGAAGDPASLPAIARRSGRSLYELCTSIGGATRTHRVERQ